MSYYIIKIIISLILILTISELGKYNSFFGALLASLPIISLLSILWIYIDTKDSSRIIELSNNIFWLVIPSLTLFIILPLLLKANINFYLSIFISIVCTFFSYFIMTQILKYAGINY